MSASRSICGRDRWVLTPIRGFQRSWNSRSGQRPNPRQKMPLSAATRHMERPSPHRSTNAVRSREIASARVQLSGSETAAAVIGRI